MRLPTTDARNNHKINRENPSFEFYMAVLEDGHDCTAEVKRKVKGTQNPQIRMGIMLKRLFVLLLVSLRN